MMWIAPLRRAVLSHQKNVEKVYEVKLMKYWQVAMVKLSGWVKDQTAA